MNIFSYKFRKKIANTEGEKVLTIFRQDHSWWACLSGAFRATSVG